MSEDKKKIELIFIECRGLRLSCKTYEDGFIDKAGKLSNKVDGNLAFLS